LMASEFKFGKLEKKAHEETHAYCVHMKT
jgi:hypothetical protein